MSNPTGDCAQSSREEEEREGELLCLMIKAQLEDLFSDGHLAQDGFLLKHVQRNKQGYVSLKLLTCLKKIKVLTTDWHMTLAGAEYSKLLEVNDECTKVRRKEPLPKRLQRSPSSKLLLAWNISEEKNEEDGVASGLEHPPLSERIFQKFSAYGNITSTWILYPGKELPEELQKYAKHHKELGQRLCAVVRFEHLEAVRKAYSLLKAEEKSDREGMHVVPLGLHSMPHLTREENNQGPPGDENQHETSPNSVQEESSLTVQLSAEILSTSQPQESQKNTIQKTWELISTSSNSQSSGLKQGCIKMSWCSGDWDNSPSPWVLRRKFAATAINPKVAGDLNERCFMQRVLRQPFGPDGTKGFHCRDRATARGRNTLLVQ
ncbi:la-related protein 6b [Notolabrus celidotus]|uniref:la-related protein 6b n=1 Tax=Notolabrus celidotus TaxID=1203425 RepID=UPI00148F7525|nr:la-related protein 6b [Notolabrus celidotus]